MSDFTIQPFHPYQAANAQSYDSKAHENASGDDKRLAGLKAEDSKSETKDTECQTCKNRKYQDGSDEMVSFKNAAHIAPESAGAVVRSHEQEHVRNAYAKATTQNGKVVSASVTLKTAICPECGRSYVSGGTTRTQIRYYNEENPYQKDLKNADYTKCKGMNADYSL